MKILIFLQGTIIMHRGAVGKNHEEIVKQIREQEPSVRDHENYIPIGKAVTKLQRWVSHGAEICYISSLAEDKKTRGNEFVGKEGLKADKNVLERYGFPNGSIYHRAIRQNYQNLVEQMQPLPNVLIEDDCESIGGEIEMIYPRLADETKKKIHSVVIKEFEGVDHLPDDPLQL